MSPPCLQRIHATIPPHHVYHFIRRVGLRDRLVYPGPRLDGLKPFPAVLTPVRFYGKHLHQRRVLVDGDRGVEADAPSTPELPRAHCERRHDRYDDRGTAGSHLTCWSEAAPIA